jgi:FkbM family methyltransferase
MAGSAKGVKSQSALKIPVFTTGFETLIHPTLSGRFFFKMRILNQNLFRLGLIFAPLFHLRWVGEKTFIQQFDSDTKLKMRVNTYDRLAAYEVWGLEEYKDKQFIIDSADVVIDIGAHIGSFSVWAARQASNGRVYAFEPNDENHAFLVENKKLNNLTNLETFNLAVSDKDGEASFFNSDHLSMSHSFFETGAENTTTVRTVSLAGILEANHIERVNYLKIDAEGAEYLIVLNTPPEVLSKVDKIFIEFHDYLDHGHHYKDIENYLSANGFQVETGRSFLFRYIFKQGFIKAVRQVNMQTGKQAL